MTRFLNQFKLLNKNHEMKNVMLIKKFSEYCKSEIQKEIKTQESYITINWEQFQWQLCKQYYWYDTYQQMYSKSFLKVYKNQKCTINNDIEFYCSTFKSILTNFETQQMLDNYTRCCWFLTELSKKCDSSLWKNMM